MFGEEVGVGYSFDGHLDSWITRVAFVEFIEIHHSECLGDHLMFFVVCFGRQEGLLHY